MPYSRYIRRYFLDTESLLRDRVNLFVKDDMDEQKLEDMAKQIEACVEQNAGGDEVHEIEVKVN